MSATAYDQSRAEAFAGRMLELLNGGALSVMISVGHRTGLFDALAELDDATSQELADAAALHERYVGSTRRDDGRPIVEVDPRPRATRFRPSTPPGSRVPLSGQPRRRGTVDHQLSTVEDDIVECFRPAAACPTTAIRAFTR